MKKISILVIVGVIIIALLFWWFLPTGKPQPAFGCPVLKSGAVIQESIQQRNVVTNDLSSQELGNAIRVIARDLKQKYPSADNTDIVDYLMSAYCPIVEKRDDLSENEKRSQMDSFSSQLLEIVGSK